MWSQNPFFSGKGAFRGLLSQPTEVVMLQAAAAHGVVSNDERVKPKQTSLVSLPFPLPVEEVEKPASSIYAAHLDTFGRRTDGFGLRNGIYSSSVSVLPRLRLLLLRDAVAGATDLP